ncbi:right-handed parallel beta-helix repeat-containing protein [Candidatus Woesearchaeota archaeon]|nr:right-handed parallel beta-helix repeat-containing protein [Candidatus Woesearchaeota archaeon]
MKRVVVLLILLIFIIPFVNAVDVDSCQTISSAGSYVLTQSLVSVDGNDCIIINVDDVDFDLAGFYISGATSGDSIYVDGLVTSNVTIHDGFVNNSAGGVSIQGSGITLINMTSYTHTNYGFYIRGSENNVTGSTANDSLSGFDIFGNSHNISDNFGYYNQNYDFTIGSIGSTINGNTAEGAQSYNFYIWGLGGATGNIIYNNTANIGTGNSFNGFYVDRTSDNNISYNVVNGTPYSFAISATDSDSQCGNVIEGNTINGGGSIIYLNDTTIDSASVDNQTIGQLILCNADDSIIYGVNVDDSPEATNGIYIYRTNNIVINSSISSNNRDPLNLNDGSTNNSFVNNVFDGNSDALSLNSGNDQNTFDNNTIINSLGTALSITSSNNNFVNNNITNNTNYAFFIFGGDNNNISYNNIQSNGWAFWLASGAANNLIDNNDIDGTTGGEAILLAESSNYNNISNNNITNTQTGIGTGTGIYFFTNEWFVGSPTGNRIFNNNISSNNYGIYLTSIPSTEYNHIYDNVQIDGNSYSIWAYNSSALNITNNSLNVADVVVNEIILFNEVNDSFINLNTISLSDDDGIAFTNSHNNSINYNTIEYNSGDGIDLSLNSNNNLISYNTISNNAQGITVSSIDTIDILFNTMQNNTLSVAISDSDSANVTNNTINDNTRGVYLINDDNSFVTLNTFNVNNYSITFDNVNNSLVDSNTIINSSYGIEFVSSSNNNFSSNTIRDGDQNYWGAFNTYGFVIDTGNDNNRIYENTIYNLYAGIFSVSGNPLGFTHIYNNYNISNNYDGINLGNNSYGLLLSSINSIISSNNISNSIYNGIYLTSVINSSFNNNQIVNSGDTGFVIDGSEVNLSGNNASLNGAGDSGAQYDINPDPFGGNSIITFTGDNYASNSSETVDILRVNEGGLVIANYYQLITPALNFSFLNATNVTFNFTTSNLSQAGVSATTCNNSSEICDIASNLLIINNLTDESNIFNLTIYYNSSDLNSTFNESDLTVARYNSGWDSLGNSFEINTTAQFVRLIGDLTSFSPWAAVTLSPPAEEEEEESSSSSSTTSTTSGGCSQRNSGAPDRSSSQNQQQEAGEPGQKVEFSYNLGEGSVNGRLTYQGSSNPSVTVSSPTGSLPESVSSLLMNLNNNGGGGIAYEISIEDLPEGLESSLILEFRISLEELSEPPTCVLTRENLGNFNIYVVQVMEDGSRVRLDSEYTLEEDYLIISVTTRPNAGYFIIMAEPNTASEPTVSAEEKKEDAKGLFKKNIGLLSIILTILGVLCLGYFAYHELKIRGHF